MLMHCEELAQTELSRGGLGYVNYTLPPRHVSGTVAKPLQCSEAAIPDPMRARRRSLARDRRAFQPRTRCR